MQYAIIGYLENNDEHMNTEIMGYYGTDIKAAKRHYEKWKSGNRWDGWNGVHIIAYETVI